ncbi:N-acetylmuramoyl-L-alanine amidase [Nocardia jejuensis]|uniref:N-acetylmuramoyl-L-alanine amidase n=1 Tax=Nocardia jejuensis TaxID=328049 RepID=UPI00082D15D0|nr:N-acetylmuramoyl-L-alanine amidase [Nocardia jejuensis]
MKPRIIKAGVRAVVTAAAFTTVAGIVPATAWAAPVLPDLPQKLAGKTIFLDPGHQGPNHNQDVAKQVNDGRGGTKPCQTSGMSTLHGIPEHTINWNVAQLVRTSLEGLGAKVVFSRPDDTGWGGCVDDRAKAASNSGADVAISIHADSGPADGRGFHLIVPQLPIPDPKANEVQSVAGLSANKAMRDAYTHAGFPVATYNGAVEGLQTRNDIAGPALTTVPDVFLEMGNGANVEDAQLLETPEGQLRHAVAITTGLASYLLGISVPATDGAEKASAGTDPLSPEADKAAPAPPAQPAAPESPAQPALEPQPAQPNSAPATPAEPAQPQAAQPPVAAPQAPAAQPQAAQPQAAQPQAAQPNSVQPANNETQTAQGQSEVLNWQQLQDQFLRAFQGPQEPAKEPGTEKAPAQPGASPEAQVPPQSAPGAAQPAAPQSAPPAQPAPAPGATDKPNNGFAAAPAVQQIAAPLKAAPVAPAAPGSGAGTQSNPGAAAPGAKPAPGAQAPSTDKNSKSDGMDLSSMTGLVSTAVQLLGPLAKMLTGQNGVASDLVNLAYSMVSVLSGTLLSSSTK